MARPPPPRSPPETTFLQNGGAGVFLGTKTGGPTQNFALYRSATSKNTHQFFISRF